MTINLTIEMHLSRAKVQVHLRLTPFKGQSFIDHLALIAINDFQKIINLGRGPR